MTQHLNVLTERADSVSLRNQELQKELVDSQMESTRLRKDCTQLVQVSFGILTTGSNHTYNQVKTDAEVDESSSIFIVWLKSLLRGAT